MTRDDFFRATVEHWDISLAPGVDPESAVWSYVANYPAALRPDLFDGVIGRAVTLLDPKLAREVINAVASAKLTIDVLAT